MRRSVRSRSYGVEKPGIHPVEFSPYNYPGQSEKSPKGVIVSGGKIFSGAGLDNLIRDPGLAAISAQMDEVAFAVAKVDPELFPYWTRPYRQDWYEIENDREIVNFLPHIDPGMPFLYAPNARAAKTVITAKIPAIDALIRTVKEVLLPKYPVFSHYLNYMEHHIDEEIIRSEGVMQNVYSNLDRWVKDLIVALSKHPLVSDQDMFDIAQRTHHLLSDAGFTYEHDWGSGDIVVISRNVAHYRLMKTVNEVSQVRNGLYNLKPRKERGL